MQGSVHPHPKDSHFTLRQSGGVVWMLQGLRKSSETAFLYFEFILPNNKIFSSPSSFSLPLHLKQLLPSGFQELPFPSYILSGQSQFWHIFIWAQLADVFPSHAFLRSKVYPKMYSLPLTQGKQWKLSDLRTAAGSVKTAKTVEST